ncbi:MAG: aspartate kinase [Christensenellales bacterium]
MNKQEVIVCKFGGTSMATKDAILNVKKIISLNPARRFVVVSAPGKRYDGDIKVTDLLYACFEQKQASGSCGQAFYKVRERFDSLLADLGLDIDLSPYYKEIEEGINRSASADYAASRGEYLAAIVMAAVLGYKFCDSAQLIEFDEKGRYASEATIEKAEKELKAQCRVVIPGFYGAKPNGEITTFSRGGSDITGAIIAKAVQADVYENWTDVNGFMTADPRIVKDPLRINALTYDELRELSYMGANVLHPLSTFPVKEKNIPINIKNTFDIEDTGTFIVPNFAKVEERTVTGIAGKRGYHTIFIKKSMMNDEIGFGRKALSVLEDLGISFEHLPTGIDTMSIIIENSQLKGKEQKVVDKLQEVLRPDYIELTSGLALIAIVGRGMIKRTGTAARVCKALADNDINIRMIDQGSSELNIIIGVSEKDCEEAIRALYNEFFGPHS